MRAIAIVLPLLLALVGCARRPAPVASPAPPAPTAAPATLPAYDCPRTSAPITIDGRADEPVWAKAPTVGPFALWNGKPAKEPTTAKLLWDDKNLYVMGVCKDPQIMPNLPTKRDENLWEKNEVFEIFVDAAGDQLCYLEFEVNPPNALVDLLIPEAGAPGSVVGRKCWDARGMKTATVVGQVSLPDGPAPGWSVEMAIPLEDFIDAANVPPKMGETWRSNLYRVDESSGQVEYQAWSPTNTPKPAFHVPERFGVLRFVEGPSKPQ